MDHIIEIDAVRSNQTYYHVNDGFYYTASESSGNFVFLKCKENYGLKCSGRAVMPLLPANRTINALVITKPHTHAPDTRFGEMLQLRRRIMDRCQADLGLPQLQIFNEECSRVPLEISSMISYESIRCSVYRKRRELTDTIPQNLSELQVKLIDPTNARYARTISNDKFYYGSTTRNGVSVIFCSKYFMEMNPQTAEVHIDGTFKVRPHTPPSRQLLTVMGIYFDKEDPFIVEAGPVVGQPGAALVDVEGNVYCPRYRTLPTTHRPNVILPAWFIQTQARELAESTMIGPPEEPAFAAGEGEPSCCICLENAATRMAIPCAHYIVCRDCLINFVSQERFYTIIGEGGETEPTLFREPITCPTCRAIVGQVIPTY